MPPNSIAQLQARIARLKAALDKAERQLTLAALRETGGNRTHAAALLGIPLRTMFRHVAALGEAAPPPPEPPARDGV